MKRLKVFRLILIFICTSAFSQIKVTGYIYDDMTNIGLSNVSIFNPKTSEIKYSNKDGYYEIVISNYDTEISFYLEGYNLYNKVFGSSENKENNIRLSSNIEILNEVIVRANKKRIFQIQRMKDIEETKIYAGKKNEVILLELSMANLASNNARQIYNQIPGLNIYQNDDAGIQLNIGGRGLDPNRTANFNTRQNDYDISADALGYPESYYTPPAEGIQEIQILRGASSLQYGTQFGGLINFKIKSPKEGDNFELITRNTLGSNNLYTNFTSISSSNEKSSYYGYVNLKSGEGFRPNSNFESINTFQNFNISINKNIKITSEITYLKYLAQQAGGLSDKMFIENPYQSIRERNWFEVEWFLYNLKYLHKLSDKSNFSFNFFGLEAKRNSLGFRTNRVDQIDLGEVRDLIKGKFSNFGIETRYLTSYDISSIKSYLLLGIKYYNSFSTSTQGPGSSEKKSKFFF